MQLTSQYRYVQPAPVRSLEAVLLASRHLSLQHVTLVLLASGLCVAHSAGKLCQIEAVCLCISGGRMWIGSLCYQVLGEHRGCRAAGDSCAQQGRPGPPGGVQRSSGSGGCSRITTHLSSCPSLSFAGCTSVCVCTPQYTLHKVFCELQAHAAVCTVHAMMQTWNV